MDNKQKPFFRKFGNAVRELRLKKKMTLEDLIEFGFSAAHFQKLETGQKAVSLYTAHRIAKALGVKVQDLLAFSDTKE